MKSEGRVTYAPSNMAVLSGSSYCYRSADAALRQSRRVTTNPGVTALEVAGEPVYLADGDYWINDSGRQGQHYYGVGGRYITLVEVS